MSKVADFVGKIAVHKYYGLVSVDSAPPRSKAMVNISVTQRGKGWNEEKEAYERYKDLTIWHVDGSRTLRWRYTHQDLFGTKDTVHINSLTPIQDGK